MPALVKAGYTQRFSLGLVTSSGSLGLLLPPSMPLIIYGIIVQQMHLEQQFTFEDLFLAGLIPGLLMMASLSAWVIWTNRGVIKPKQAFTWTETLAAVKEARWELPLPLFVMAGLFSGFLAISEMAAIGFETATKGL